MQNRLLMLDSVIYFRILLNMINYPDIMRLPHETIFLINTLCDIVVRSVTHEVRIFFAKHKGGKEYIIYHLSDLLQDTLRENKKITNIEYANF